MIKKTPKLSTEHQLYLTLEVNSPDKLGRQITRDHLWMKILLGYLPP